MTSNIAHATGLLHKASCIVMYVADSSLEADQIGIGETLKAAERMLLDAIEVLQELEGTA